MNQFETSQEFKQHLLLAIDAMSNFERGSDRALRMAWNQLGRAQSVLRKEIARRDCGKGLIGYER